MKKLIYWLLKYQLYKVKKSLESEETTIIRKEKEHRIKVYESALIFLY